MFSVQISAGTNALELYGWLCYPRKRCRVDYRDNVNDRMIATYIYNARCGEVPGQAPAPARMDGQPENGWSPTRKLVNQPKRELSGDYRWHRSRS
jgi:hypothetical protein